MSNHSDDLAAIAAELPQLLSSEQTAKLLGIDVRSLRNRHYRGQPPLPLRVGSRLRYTKAEVLRYLAGEP